MLKGSFTFQMGDSRMDVVIYTAQGLPVLKTFPQIFPIVPIKACGNFWLKVLALFASMVSQTFLAKVVPCADALLNCCWRLRQQTMREKVLLAGDK